MTKTFTSSSANKHLRRLAQEKDQLTTRELSTCTYVRATGEVAEPPLYDYAATCDRIRAIDDETYRIRHALHAFNVRTQLPDDELTIDEALVVLAQLSADQRRLDKLRSRQSKQRLSSSYYGQGGAVEYEYANYDIARAERDYQQVTDRIYDLQTKLDLCNQTISFEVDLPEG